MKKQVCPEKLKRPFTLILGHPGASFRCFITSERQMDSVLSHSLLLNAYAFYSKTLPLRRLKQILPVSNALSELYPIRQNPLTQIEGYRRPRWQK